MVCRVGSNQYWFPCFPNQFHAIFLGKKEGRKEWKKEVKKEVRRKRIVRVPIVSEKVHFRVKSKSTHSINAQKAGTQIQMPPMSASVRHKVQRGIAFEAHA